MKKDDDDRNLARRISDWDITTLTQPDGTVVELFDKQKKPAKKKEDEKNPKNKRREND